jgi:hypothetical protein
MKYLACLLIISITSANSLRAETTDNLAVKYAEAAAYHLIVHQAVKQSGAKYAELTKTSGDSYDYCCIISMLLASQTRDSEMAGKVTLSRVEYFKKGMQKEMGHRNENISILMNKYQDSSFKLINQPSSIVKQLLAEVNSVQK